MPEKTTGKENLIIGNVKGISKSARAVLAEHGIFSVEELAVTGVAQLQKIPGFSAQKAERMIRAAKHLVGDMEKDNSAMRLQGKPALPPRPAGFAEKNGEFDLNDPKLYINRELSLLEFNWRVLEQAKDKGTPLLERLNFLCISCSNLDEFFEVRVAGLIQMAELGAARNEPDGLSPGEVLAAINQRAHELVAEQYRVLNEVMLPALVEQTYASSAAPSGKNRNGHG